MLVWYEDLDQSNINTTRSTTEKEHYMDENGAKKSSLDSSLTLYNNNVRLDTKLVVIQNQSHIIH